MAIPRRRHAVGEPYDAVGPGEPEVAVAVAVYAVYLVALARVRQVAEFDGAYCLGVRGYRKTAFVSRPDVVAFVAVDTPYLVVGKALLPA